MQASSFTLVDHDGVDLFVRRWKPDGQAKAVVQIVHGMREHSQRYEKAAAALVAGGYAVYADDHRGHGRTASGPAGLGHLGPGGWRSVLKDLQQVTCRIEEENPDLPIFLLGHSWGSFLSQAYMQHASSRFQGVLLSGTNGRDPLVAVGVSMSRLVSRLVGYDKRAVLLDKVTLGRFNKAFEPGSTGLEWLSRDPEVVQRAVDDPLFPDWSPNGFFVELASLLSTIWRPENEKRIRKDLPLFVFAGGDDPVGHRTKGIEALLSRYKSYGMTSVRHKFYPGGRHEMLNETNRDEVYADVIGWLDEHCAHVEAKRAAVNSV